LQGWLHPIFVIDDVELLIVGGGLVGLMLAAACGGAGLPVTVVDPQDPAASLEDPFDGRTSAIAAGSRNVLEAIGVWPQVAGDAEPILEIRVADDNSPLFLHYDHRELGSDEPLGYIVENRVLRRALIERVQSTPNLVLLAPLAVSAVSRTPLGATASLSDGRYIKARLVAAADGQRSPLRRAAAIGSAELRYHQIAIVTVVRHERPHRCIAVEHFLPAGPFAILPMTGNRSSIVWTERTELAPQLISLSDSDFAKELAARFGDFLDDIEPIGPRWSYPLGLLLAERYVAQRLALVGDSAHMIHPIAGQGLNLGIRDVASLAELAIDARRLGLDIGDGSILRRYERWRRFDAVALATVTHGLNRMFSNTFPPLRLSRELGLAAVQRLPPLKRAFMRDAMGIVGNLPRLVRGEPL
jgi:2-octaprenyl-6-methoxyphenol hydroxylase